jgi:sphingomyelin phosphodiesterase acid-like 3
MNILRLTIFILLLTATGLPAQTIPALFLSDIHYDPLRDPALAPRLNSAPATQWPEILATPASPTLEADAAAVQKACPVRGDDPDQTLWQSSLQAMKAQAGNPRFLVLSGDLLPHNFDCRYNFLFPDSTHADFLNFSENTLRYVVASLRATFPGVPLYMALGNNDTACVGNRLDPNNDFLALTAKVIAEGFPLSERKAIVRDVSAGGYYSVAMTGAMRHTRMLVVDNLFFLTEFSTCDQRKDYSEEPLQIAWLRAQMAEARRRHETVWVLGHVPPGVSLYTTFAMKNKNICAGDQPSMSLDTERLAATIGANADIVRLAIFAHTHSDAFGLIQPNLGDPIPKTPALARLGPGVPMKVVASISAVNGNNPSFTLATVDPRTASIRDYTVVESSNLTGLDATWSKRYTYSEDFREPDFTAQSLANLIADFRADPLATRPASKAYLDHHYSTADSSAVTRWPYYVCAMDHDSAASFTACACAVAPPAQ